MPGQDDLALIVKRVEALGEFLETDDGANLLAGLKRAASILAIEEKKDKTSYDGDYDIKLLQAPEELALAAAIESTKQDTSAAIAVENFKGAMRALGRVAPPRRRLFREGDGQRRGPESAPEPVAASLANPRGYNESCGFLQDCGVIGRSA